MSSRIDGPSEVPPIPGKHPLHAESISDASSSHGSSDVNRSTKQDDSRSSSEASEKGKVDENIVARPKTRILMIMVALCLASFLAALDVTIITTALPTIAEEFHSAQGYSWIGSSFLIANGAAVPIWGKISDVFGRKPMLLLANIVFMAGSLVAALSYSITMLIAARAVQGVGAGGLVTLVNIVIGDLFPLDVRGMVSKSRVTYVYAET